MECEQSVNKNIDVQYDGSYKFSPFTVICSFICKLCKDLCQELLILLFNRRKTMRNTLHWFPPLCPKCHLCIVTYLK